MEPTEIINRLNWFLNEVAQQKDVDDQELAIALINRYRFPLLAYIRSRGMNDERDREDVLSLVFEAVINEIHRCSVQPEHLDRLVFTIARNKAVSHYRKNKSQSSVIDLEKEVIENLPTPGTDKGLEDRVALVEDTIRKIVSELRDCIARDVGHKWLMYFQEYPNPSNEELCQLCDNLYTEKQVKDGRGYLIKEIKKMLKQNGRTL